MKRIGGLLRSEWVVMPLLFVIAAGSGFLLASGTVSGVASPLAAAVAGICHPVYGGAILLGSLIAYITEDAAPGLQFLLAALTAVVGVRILFRETYSPHVLGVMTALSCTAAGTLLDLVIYPRAGNLPVYLLESVLTGIAAYFLADGWQSLRENRRISLDPGRRFTYAVCYLLGITALCGADFSWFNVGRCIGIAFTMLCARQFSEKGGTLCGALTACGTALCSVRLGMPMLFLPVTAMLAGFLVRLPQALWIPVFFVMQMLSAGVLDGSRGIAKVFVEVLAACGIYALASPVELYRYLMLSQDDPISQSCLARQEQMLGAAVQELREEASAVMSRLTVAVPADPVASVRAQICADCKNCTYCWKLRQELTERAFRQLLHEPERNSGHPVLDNCIRRTRLLSAMTGAAHKNALMQMQRVHVLQSRSVTLEYLHLLGDLAGDCAGRRMRQCCIPETQALRGILRRCACEEASCYVYRLRRGRYAAEIYTRQTAFPEAAVQKLLQRQLGTPLLSMQVQHGDTIRYCFCEVPAYRLEHETVSVHAPSYERCGDHADAFCDSAGNSYLVLSDGMGSGSTASLAARIAVRTFRRMVCSEMPAATAIRLVNTLLMAETNTENFATLDVLQMDADSGEMSLWKSGATPTLFWHHGRLHRITAESFPVGIMTDAAPGKRRLFGMEEDLIVMTSDGISEAEYPYIREVLLRHPEPAQAAAEILAKAPVFHGGVCRDDVTVIVGKVTLSNLSNSTNEAAPAPVKEGQIVVNNP